MSQLLLRSFELLLLNKAVFILMLNG